MFYDRQLERQGDSMQISILLMEQIFELFLMILMGFIIVKAGIVKEEDSKVLSKIVLYLIIPCVIINAFQVDYTKKTVNGLLIALAASVLLQVVLLLVVFVMGKLFLYLLSSVDRAITMMRSTCFRLQSAEMVQAVSDHLDRKSVV